MDPLLWCVVLAGAFGAMLWQRGRVQRLLGPAQLNLDEAAEIVMHLARHEASSRQRPLSPLYLLYALVQDERIAEVIAAAGGDVAAVEDRVFRALEDDREGDFEQRWVDTHNVIAWAMYMAARGERLPGPAELWGGVVQMAPDTAALVEAGGVRAADVLSILVHGETAGALPERGNVAIVLVNDDITSQELVVDILRHVFDLSEQDAMTRMLVAHNEGFGVVARYPAAIARDKLRDAHERARAKGSPLLFRVQP